MHPDGSTNQHNSRWAVYKRLNAHDVSIPFSRMRSIVRDVDSYWKQKENQRIQSSEDQNMIEEDQNEETEESTLQSDLHEDF